MRGKFHRVDHVSFPGGKKLTRNCRRAICLWWLTFLLTAKHMLGRSLFLLQNGFLAPVYCQISTDLNKILHTPIVVRNTLVGRLRPRSARGRLRAKPERLFFSVIHVTDPLSRIIETTHRSDFGGKPSKWRSGRVLSWKIPEFCSVGRARSKTTFFRVFRVPCDYAAHSLQKTVLPEINGTDGKPRLWKGVTIARLESLWPGICQI